MTNDELKIVVSPQFRAQIEENILRDPLKIALDKNMPNAQLVASTVKYLQRAKEKLPSLYMARCIIPSLAFEQSSAESVAMMRNLQGETAIDLTAGLGVDTVSLSRKFRKVYSIEKNEVLAKLLRYNLSLLGIENVEVFCCCGEEFLNREGLCADLIFVDPDRRSDKGKKLYKLEDCSPNVVALQDKMKSITEHIYIKCSPLFDIDEAFRLFDGNVSVDVISLKGECKEVSIELGSESGEIRVLSGGNQRLLFNRNAAQSDSIPMPQDPAYLIVPDVALQKSRTAIEYYSQRGIHIADNNGYGFSQYKPKDILGKVYKIESMRPFKEFRSMGKATIMHKLSPLSTAQITKELKIKEGGSTILAFTSINKTMIGMELKENREV